MVQEKIGIAIGGVIAVLLIASVAGAASNYIENADSNTEWNSNIDDASSSDYLVENDSAYLQSDTALIHTTSVDTSTNENVSVNAELLKGAATVTVYDSTDTQLDTQSLTGESSYSYDVADSVDSVYLEISSDQVDDSRLDSFTVEEPDDELVGWLEIMITAVLGAALILMF